MIARAIRLLGNRNVLCYCNDNRLRICHICGKMKGRVWIEPGDMVLVSLREFETHSEEKDDRRGDIIAKYAPELLGRLRREPDSNPKLFMKLETSENLTLGEIGVDKSGQELLKAADDIGFVFEHGGSDEESEGAGGGAARNTVVSKAAKVSTEDEEINVDDI
jgi:initiation factor 1A